MKKNKKLNADSEYVYGQAITDIPKNIKNIAIKIPLYKSIEGTKLLESTGYNPKHRIMRVRYDKFNQYPYDYIYTNIDPTLYGKVIDIYGGNRLRYDIIPYMSKYPCYKLDASKSKAKVLNRPVKDNKKKIKAEIGDRVKHYVFGNGTIVDFYYDEKEDSTDTYYVVDFDYLDEERTFGSWLFI